MNTPDRLRWARALVTAGWLFTTAYVGLLAIEIRRAAAIRTSSFEDGVWGQRVEIISFITLPQNIMVLLPAAVATVAAALVLEGVHPDDRPTDPWLRRLVAVVGGLGARMGPVRRRPSRSSTARPVRLRAPPRCS